jgi:hypothetical protein
MMPLGSEGQRMRRRPCGVATKSRQMMSEKIGKDVAVNVDSQRRGSIPFVILRF